MKKVFSVLPVVVATMFLSGCSLYGTSAPQQPTTMPTPATNSNTQPQATVASNAINIQNFAFTPGTLTVKKGTTVTWTNNDSALHRIKSDTFNSSALGKGQTFSFTFDATGTFDYSCAIHPSMLGKIIVQ